MKTLRDEFALLRASKTSPIDASSLDEGRRILFDDWARECYEAADAFMRARGVQEVDNPPEETPPPPPPEPLFDSFEDEPVPWDSAAYESYPASKDGLVFSADNMEIIEAMAYQWDAWLTKWKGVKPCRICVSMVLTPLGYKCEACGSEDIPF